MDRIVASTIGWGKEVDKRAESMNETSTNSPKSLQNEDAGKVQTTTGIFGQELS